MNTDYEALYKWIDELPITRQKRNLNRDFSDAVPLAEILKHYYPKLVELHNYTPRSALAQKIINWHTLNRKVLVKLKLALSNEDVEQLAKSAPGAIEKLLLDVKRKIETRAEGDKTSTHNIYFFEEFNNKPSEDLAFKFLYMYLKQFEVLSKMDNSTPSTSTIMSPPKKRSIDLGHLSSNEKQCILNMYKQQLRDEPDKKINMIVFEISKTLGKIIPIKVKSGTRIVEQKVVPSDVFDKMQSDLNEKEAVIKSLKSKVDHLENLLGIKSARIEDLTKQLENVMNEPASNIGSPRTRFFQRIFN